MNKPFCITFAGAVGSGKTPIATYLSYHFDLPIFNNDAIRSEIYEDFWVFSHEEHLSRRNQRLQFILKKWKSFICDASIDRIWESLKDELDKYGYRKCIISLDISEERLRRFYESKSYDESLKGIIQNLQDHENFLKNYPDAVNLHITDTEYPERIKLTEKFIEKWIWDLKFTTSWI